MITSIQYISKKTAEMLDPATLPWAHPAVISIGDDGNPATLHPDFAKVLRVVIPDSARPDPDLQLAAANAILDYLEELSVSRHEYSLIVHCILGKSRSCAVSRYASEITGTPVTHIEHEGAPRPGSESLYRLLSDTQTARDHCRAKLRSARRPG